MIDFVREISNKTGISRNVIIVWLGLAASKFYDWKKRYGRENRHNGWIPRDWWLLESEREAIIRYYLDHPFEGYRRLTYMMLDEDVVAVSPATVYRVLSKEGLLGRKKHKPSKKGTGFVQPLKPHQHWHVDICYLNIDGTFYYLCMVLDGFSRYIVHWEIREQMKELDVELIIERARQKFPEANPRIISDNGPQFVSGDFKEYVKLCGMTHVRTSPYYPQSNGKLERVNKTVKNETIRKQPPKDVDDARRIVGQYVEHYNTRRLHSAIDYISPLDKLEGRAKDILARRELKLQEARAKRKEADRENIAA